MGEVDADVTLVYVVETLRPLGFEVAPEPSALDASLVGEHDRLYEMAEIRMAAGDDHCCDHRVHPKAVQEVQLPRHMGGPQQGAGKARCRLHGGLSTGPKTPEGKARIAAAQWKHGRRSRAFTEARKQIWADLRAVEARMRADGLI